MLYILDTDTITALQARREPVLRRVATIAKDDLTTTVITLREQLRGRLAIIEQATEGPALVQAYEMLYATALYFSRINVLPFTAAAVVELANLRAKGSYRHTRSANRFNYLIRSWNFGDKQSARL